jgi:hypothetical protein
MTSIVSVPVSRLSGRFRPFGSPTEARSHTESRPRLQLLKTDRKKEKSMNLTRVVVVISMILFGTGLATAQTEWTFHPENPVIGPGEPGGWDEAYRSSIAVHFDGSVYHLWFQSGTQSEGISIGHAMSPDGVDWTMDPANPVLLCGGPDEWDRYLFGAGLVHDGTEYRMWYSGWGTPTGTWQGGYATSPDGTVWTKHPDNPVLTSGEPGAWDDRDAGPFAAILEGGTYRLWYSGSDGNIEQVGYAHSTDGVRWTKLPNPVLEVGRYPGVWDSTWVANPTVVFDGTTYHLWYVGSDGSGFKTGYAFSNDGLGWTKHRGNPVLHPVDGGFLTSPTTFDGTTFHMWSTHDYPDGTTFIEYATSVCCPGDASLDSWKFIPAAAVASGAQGAFFQTDVDLSNADDQEVEYEFSWLPRGETNTEPLTSEVFTLGAGMSARYTNVLSEVFDLEPNSVGGLLIKSSHPDLLAMSRTYNLPSAKQTGTFGQAMPSIPDADFFPRGDRRRLVFGTENADMRFNVGCQNGTDTAAIVSFELFAADGRSLGTDRMILRSFANDQLNLIFDQYRPVTGYVDFWSDTPMSEIYCYGSLLDNVTSDPTTIPPQ